MDIYNQIIDLRNASDNVQKGYLFEQTMREIHPWDFKPPITYTAPSEQLDGVFTWKGITFIIEAKAKEGIITQGSHDWEDFELKIRRRKGKGIIGIFCSLYLVHENVFEAGYRLNQEGIQTIIFDGSFWDSLANNFLPMSDILEFMIPYIRIKYVAKPPEIQKIKKWSYDKTSINKKIRDKAIKESASFLRRYKHKFHDTIYVERELDKFISSATSKFKPSSLSYNKEISYRELPKQVMIIRDMSGAGKTTTSVQIANSNNDYNSLVITANDSSIDETIVQFLNSFGQDLGLSSLIEINKPIIYVIDSLDEAKINIQKKRREIISLFRFMEEINKNAETRKLRLFPLIILFTVREDYWRDWENLFEDIRVKKIRKKMTSFNSLELKQAINNYTKAYNYNIVNNLSSETEIILSQPINLQILSESNEYQGEVVISELWETSILYSYFERKKDDIFKHPIVGFSSKSFMLLLSELAFFVIKKKQNSFHRTDFKSLIEKLIPNQATYYEDILLILVSEQLLIKDIKSGDKYRFKHSKFIEYLCSYYLANSVYQKDSTVELDYFTSAIFDSGIVSMYNVHDNTRLICDKLFPEINEKILDYYSTSDKYLSQKLLTLRSHIAVGEETDIEDINLILKNTSSNSAEITWSSFFVLVAKKNSQPANVMLEIFNITWKSNNRRIDRWKLLIKMANHYLLTDEKVVINILSSNSEIEWERYLGLILDTNQRKEFKSIQKEIPFKDKMNKFRNNKDWQYVIKLFDIIMTDKKYILGEE